MTTLARLGLFTLALVVQAVRDTSARGSAGAVTQPAPPLTCQAEQRPTERQSASAFAPAMTGSAVSRDDAQRALDCHNRARREVGTEPVTWSVQLAEYAQEWANHLAENQCPSWHRPTGWELIPGENLFLGGEPANAVKEALLTWYDEKRDYDEKKDYNHYTQMVWRTTTQFGMGLAKCPRGGTIVVANYDSAQVANRKPY